MNKKEITDKIARDTGLSKKDVLAVLESLMSNIKKALKDKVKVILVGFGTFLVKRREARTGRNPQTGESIKIPAKNVIKFTAGKELKDEVNS